MELENGNGKMEFSLIFSRVVGVLVCLATMTNRMNG